MILQVQRLEQTKLAQLAEQSEDLENIHKSLSQCLTLVDDILTRKDPYEFLTGAAAVVRTSQCSLRKINLAGGEGGEQYQQQSGGADKSRSVFSP